jgi:hypothetical protein
MTALVEVVPNVQARVIDFDAVPRTAQRYELLAQLTRGLASAMLEGVQRTAQLNFEAAHHLLARTCTPLAEQAEAGAESLRFARRTYEVCAITASRVLRLCRDHVQRDADQVWQALDEGLDRLALNTEHAAELRAAFTALRASHAEYFDAMLRMHEELRAIADGVMVVGAPSGARRVNGPRVG